MVNSLLQEILEEDPSLMWYVPKEGQLSDASIMEHVLNYGNWEQVQKMIGVLGKDKSVEVYRSIADKPRTNLRKKTKHYFDLYFSRAFGNSN